jgi:hypothetical protein
MVASSVLSNLLILLLLLREQKWIGEFGLSNFFFSTIPENVYDTRMS